MRRRTASANGGRLMWRMAVRLYMSDQNDVLCISDARAAAKGPKNRRTRVYVNAMVSVPKAAESTCALSGLKPSTACTPACR